MSSLLEEPSAFAFSSCRWRRNHKLGVKGGVRVQSKLVVLLHVSAVVQVELLSLVVDGGLSPKSSPLVAQATDDATLSGDEYDNILLLAHLGWRARPTVSAHERLLRRASSIRMLNSLLILDGVLTMVQLVQEAVGDDGSSALPAARCPESVSFGV